MLLDDIRATGIDVEEIESSERLEALRPEWNGLWERCSTGVTPFQSADWGIAWWRELGAGRLMTLAFRAGDELVGLAPLWIDDRPDERVVLLIGAGNSDYLDVLAAPGFESEVGARLWKHLEQAGERWDRCEFQPLRPDAHLSAMTAPHGWGNEMAPLVPCPVVKISGDKVAVKNGISSHFHKRLRQDHQRLDHAGGVVIESAQPRTLAGLLRDWVRLHSARWQRRGEVGVLSSETLFRFHLAAASGLAARGVLRFYALRVGGRVVGCYYGFLHRGRAYYYLGGFDPEFERFGVGNQLVWHALETAVDEGARTFDFLRGRESYKYRWGAVDEPTFRRSLHLYARGADVTTGGLG